MPYTPLGPYVTGMTWIHGGGPTCNYPGPYLRGLSERYLFSAHSTGEADNQLDVFRSPDLGVTWAPQDVANMPLTADTSVSTSRLNADTVRICYHPHNAGPLVPGAVIRDFDMVSNTLGPILYDLSSFYPAYAVQGPVYQRSSVAAEDRIFAEAFAGGLVGFALILFRHDGSGFLAPITIATGGIYPNDFNIQPEAFFMDSAGTSHLIYSTQRIFHAGVPQPDYAWRRFYYVQVDVAGNVNMPVLVYTTLIQTTYTFGFPALLGSKLVFPFGLQHGTTFANQFFTGSILVIDPYTSTTPTITQVGLPTEQIAATSTLVDSPSINATDLGSLMYLWWIDVQGLDGITPLSRIMYATWDGTTIGTPILFYDNIATPLIATGGLALMGMAPTYMDVADPMMAVNGNYFYTGNVPPPPPPPVIRAHLRIFGTRRMVILEPNTFDDCLKRLPELYRQIPFEQGICCVPDRYNYGQWKKFRPDAKPFRSIHAVPTPLASDGDVLVTTFWPPLGWDGVLSGIFNRYTGPGFQDGRGDIEWRLKFGPVYGKGLGNILIQMGQVNSFYKINQGIPFRSHRPIQFYVYAPNGSGGILPVNSQIVCGFEGWIFPRK